MVFERLVRTARVAFGLLLAMVVVSGGQSNVNAQEATEIPVPFVEKFLPDVTRLDWRGDGQYIAIAIERDIGIYNPSLEEIRRLEGHEDFVFMLDWSPDNTRLASVGADYTLRIWDMVESSPTYGTALTTLNESGNTLAVSWSPDGTKLAYSVFDSIRWEGNSGFTTSVVKIWDVATQTVTLTLLPQVNSAPELAWSRDSQQLATSELIDSGYAVNLWDVISGERTASYTVYQKIVRALAWKPDEDVLAVGTEGDPLTLVHPPATELTSMNSAEPNYSISWEPTGAQLAISTAKSTIRLVDSTTLQVIATLTGHKQNVYQVRWSPDGSKLASLSADEVVRVWDMSIVAS